MPKKNREYVVRVEILAVDDDTNEVLDRLDYAYRETVAPDPVTASCEAAASVRDEDCCRKEEQGVHIVYRPYAFEFVDNGGRCDVY